MRISKIVNDVEYIYDESFWTGKKTLTINGVKLTKRNRKTFEDTISGELYEIRGNYLSGLKIVKDGYEIVLCKNTWYEWILACLPFLSILIGIFGGALGGALSGLFSAIGAFINITLLRTNLNIIVKIILCILITIIVTVFWYLIFSIIVVLIDPMV